MAMVTHSMAMVTHSGAFALQLSSKSATGYKGVEQTVHGRYRAVHGLP